MVADPRLITFVQNNLSRGISVEQIKKTLIGKGWTEAKVNEAIASASSLPQQVPTIQPTISQPQRAQPKNTKPKVSISGQSLIIFGVIFVLAVAIAVIFIFSTTPKISDDVLSQGAFVNLSNGKEADFNLLQQPHKLIVNSMNAVSASITIESSPINATIGIGDTKKFDIDSNGFYDLSVKLLSITNEKANLYIKSINEAVCTENWSCTAWTDCVNSTQNRTCVDLSNCGTNFSKPFSGQICTIPSCSRQNGSICNSSQICQGTNATASDGICCIGTCVSNQTVATACGTDISCFIDAATGCTRANVTYSFTSTNSTSNWAQNNVYYYEIRGIESNLCTIHASVVNASGNFTTAGWTALQTAGNTTIEIAQMVLDTNTNLNNNFVGTTGNCHFPLDTSDLSDFLTEVQSGNPTLSSSDISTYQCTGTIFTG